MGTSLSGLTPATTFDGLLKVGDNDPLTADLKAISDGSGNDSAIQLSTGELKVLGQFNLDSDTSLTTMNLRGDSLVINQIYQANETTYNSIEMLNSAGIRLKNGTGTALLARGGNIGIGGITATPTARLQVKGSGTTSATTSLLVQNSAGSELLKVTDDGAIDFGVIGLEFSNDGSGGTMSVASDRYVKIASSLNTYSALNAHVFKTLGSGGYSEAMRITGNTDQFVGIGETTPTAKLHIKGSGATSATTSLLVQNSDGAQLFKVSDFGYSEFNQNATFYSNIYISGSIIGAAATKIGIGGSIPASTQAYIKGSGATSATTALLVQNSAGTRIMEAQDGGNIFFGASASHYLQNGYNWFGSYYFLNTQTFRGALQNDLGSVKISDDLNVGGNADNDTGVRLQVKGSGNDDTTTALLVQNSDGITALSVSDDRHLLIGDSSAQGFDANLTFIRSSGGLRGANFRQVNSDLLLTNAFGGFKVNGIQTTLKGSGATSATTALLVENSAGTEHLKVTDDGIVNARSRLIVNHITNSLRSLRLEWGSIYATDNASELSIGAVYSQAATAPKITLGGKTRAAGADAIQVQALNGMYIATTASTEDPSAQLHIKGSGTTSATTSLLVQNSAGTEHLKVTDDGVTNVRGDLVVNHPSVSSRFIGLSWGAIGANSTNDELSLYGGGSTNGSVVFLNASGKTAAPAAIGMKTNGMLVASAMVQSSFAPDASAQLQVDSTTKGFLPPRMTSGEKNAITSPAPGLMVYDTDANQMSYWNGGGWINF
jgi:hypothetical protein